MVFWMLDGFPGNQLFQPNELSQCLKRMEEIRKCPGYEFVTMASQNPDSVGKPGVSDKLPEDYSWSKQHRGDQIETEFKTIIGGRSRG